MPAAQIKIKKTRNYSAKATNYHKLVPITVQMCPRFVRFDLRCVLPVREEGETDEVSADSEMGCS